MDLTQLDVEVLRGASEDVESLIGGDPLTFHEDALRLSDQLARSQCLGQAGRPELVGSMGLCGVERESSKGGEKLALARPVAPNATGMLPYRFSALRRSADIE